MLRSKSLVHSQIADLRFRAICARRCAGQRKRTGRRRQRASQIRNLRRRSRSRRPIRPDHHQPFAASCRGSHQPVAVNAPGGCTERCVPDCRGAPVCPTRSRLRFSARGLLRDRFTRVPAYCACGGRTRLRHGHDRAGRPATCCGERISRGHPCDARRCFTLVFCSSSVISRNEARVKRAISIRQRCPDQSGVMARVSVPNAMVFVAIWSGGRESRCGRTPIRT